MNKSVDTEGNHVIKDLEPQIVWKMFDEISKIPRPSKREEKIRGWCRTWAEDHNLKFKEDKVGNIVIKIPAKEGCESWPILVLQGHLDMVCQKTPDSNHNFDEDPISMKVIDDSSDKFGPYVTAVDTTLGADNGIGMAMALAVVMSPNVKHGPLELLFTVDEETGLTGAFALEENFFTGDFLLNLDSEDHGIITISSAGGGDVKLFLKMPKQHYSQYSALIIEVSGLVGGHSGIDIHRPRSSAIKILVDGLVSVRDDVPIVLSYFNGGTAHNAIPRNASATFMFPKSEIQKVLTILERWKEERLVKRLAEDTKLMISIKEASVEESYSLEETNFMLSLLSAIPHGPQSFNPDIENLVETSNNLAIVKVHPEGVEIACSTRSAITEELNRVRNEIKELGESHTALVTLGPSYPGWKPNLQAPFLQIVKEEYSTLLGRDVELKAMHAGLECGLFTRLSPKLQIVSMGPEIKDVHSPNERVYIQSTQLVWNVLLNVISRMAELSA